MALRVNTNVSSLAAQRTLGRVNQNLSRSQVATASGDRIMKAAYDPTGLAISTKQKSHIRSRYQAMRNTQEAVSMFQVGEGALSQIHSMGGRLRELAMQAANDTFSDSDRANSNKEFQALKTEIRKITSATKYNGRHLLNGEGPGYDMQIDIHNNKGSRVKYNMGKVIRDANQFGTSGLDISSKQAAQRAIGSLVKMTNEVSSSRSEIGSIQSRMESTLNTLSIANENQSHSQSKIRDADMAYQTAENTKQSLLQDASVRSLHYANEHPRGILKLLE